MYTMRNLLCASALLVTAIAFGQTASDDATALAKARTAQLTTELGLNAKQAKELEAVLLKTEKEVADDRAECAKIDAKIHAAFQTNYESLSTMLTGDQLKKLMSTSASTCSMHPGCNHDAKTAGACCAGGKGAAPANGATPPAKTAEPLKNSISR